MTLGKVLHFSRTQFPYLQQGCQGDRGSLVLEALDLVGKIDGSTEQVPEEGRCKFLEEVKHRETLRALRLGRTQVWNQLKREWRERGWMEIKGAQGPY